jgi:hypothetical protein
MEKCLGLLLLDELTEIQSHASGEKGVFRDRTDPSDKLILLV